MSTQATLSSHPRILRKNFGDKTERIAAELGRAERVEALSKITRSDKLLSANVLFFEKGLSVSHTVVDL